LRALTEDAFTGPVRRAMFNIMAALDATGGYIDRLTVDWELTRDLGGGQWSPQGYVARLAAMDTTSMAVEQASTTLARRSADASTGRSQAASSPAPSLIQPPPGPADPGPGRTPRR
jgi:hypothetical protein